MVRKEGVFESPRRFKDAVFWLGMEHTIGGGGAEMQKNKKRIWPPQAVADELQRPIPEEVYPVLDTDLARDNVENDLPAADLEDL